MSWRALWGRGLALAVGYAAALVVASLALAARSQAGQTQWLAWASTNLANLGTHPVAAMVVSAFFAQSDLAVWVVLALLGIGVTGLALGARRTLVLVASAHVLGTLISEGILWFQIRTGALPAAQERILDVGPSYVVVSALVAAAVFGGLGRDERSRSVRPESAPPSLPGSDVDASRQISSWVARHGGRVACAIGVVILAPACFDGLLQLDVAAVGHACAAATAVGLGLVLRRRSPTLAEPVESSGVAGGHTPGAEA
jgi:hypothetical protein